MVRINKTGEVFVKILYWGCAGSGKTTAVDTLYRLTKEQFTDDVQATGDLTKIAMASGSTLYFDRGIFQSKKQSKIYYHVYTVAGQKRFSPLRRKIFTGTDGCIFVWDGQRSRLEDNLQSLRELKNIANNTLISHIPFMVMINKEDLPDTYTEKEVEELLVEEGLILPHENTLSDWNPQVEKTCALFSNHKMVYKIFAETCRRTSLYQAIGDGKAPERTKVELGKSVPDL